MKHNFLNPYEAIFERLESIENCLAQLKPNTPPIQQVQPEERFLDVKQTSQFFGVSTVSIWQWEKAGIIKSYRIGNLKRFKYSELVDCPKLIIRTQKRAEQ
jgi:predicted DNA-binding transcriptional regulator AlpA